jgi:hypothetical protein
VRLAVAAGVLVVAGFVALGYRSSRLSYPTPGPQTAVTPNPDVVSFAASDAAAEKRARLSERHRREIRAVQRVLAPAVRARLVVSLPAGNDADGIVLFLGDPRYPDGLVPAAVAGDSPAEVNGRPVLIEERYRAFGDTCHDSYLPAEGVFGAVTEAGCTGFSPSAADRIAAAYGLPPGNLRR